MAQQTASSIVPSPDRSQKFGFFNRCPKTVCGLWNFLFRTPLQFPIIVFVMCKLVSCKQAILSHTIAKRERNTLCEFAQSTVRHSSPSSSQGKPMPTYSNFAVRDLLLRPGKGCARRRESQSISGPKRFTWTTYACIAWNVICECIMAKHTASSIVPSPDRSHEFGFFHQCPGTVCELRNFLSMQRLQFPVIVFFIAIFHIDIDVPRCTN